MDQALNSQKTPHTSPLRASYGMSFVSILMKNDRVIKGFYCISSVFPLEITQSSGATLWYLQCISTGDNKVFCKVPHVSNTGTNTAPMFWLLMQFDHVAFSLLANGILDQQDLGCIWQGTSPRPIFCLLLRASSDYAQPITGQVTEVTCPVMGRAQPELTPSKRQKTAPGIHCMGFYPSILLSGWF